MWRANREIILFIDDLDRCLPSVTVEVLQAINLFMSGQLQGCRFVLGLDQAVVAAQINEMYGQGELAKEMTYGDDPTPGWSFLRKMIHLPVILPRLTDDTVEGYVRALLGDIEIEPQGEMVERPDSESQQKSTTSSNGVATAVTAVKAQARRRRNGQQMLAGARVCLNGIPRFGKSCAIGSRLVMASRAGKRRDSLLYGSSTFESPSTPCPT
jgi:hypothetical protein